MVVKIRLARFGRRRATFYNIVVSNARTARNSKPLEVLGTYSPYPREPLDGEGSRQKMIQMDTARAKYWIGVGAQPTDSAWDLLHKANLLPLQLSKRRAIWRTQKMDDLHRAIAKGDVTVEQMLDRVPLLDSEFAAEIAKEAKEDDEARKRQEEDNLELDIEDDGYLPDNTAFKVERSKKSAQQSVSLSRQTPLQKLKHKRRSLHGEGVNLSKRYDLGSLLLKE